MVVIFAYQGKHITENLSLLSNALTEIKILAYTYDQDTRYVFCSFGFLANRLPLLCARYATLVDWMNTTIRAPLAEYLTRIVSRVFDERCTTSNSEMTKLTAMPTSTSQMMVRKNVSAINDRSTHARILDQVRQ